MKVLSKKAQIKLQETVQSTLDILGTYLWDFDIKDSGRILDNLSRIIKLTHSSEDYLVWLKEQVDKKIK